MSNMRPINPSRVERIHNYFSLENANCPFCGASGVHFEIAQWVEVSAENVPEHVLSRVDEVKKGDSEIDAKISRPESHYGLVACRSCGRLFEQLKMATGWDVITFYPDHSPNL